MSSAKTGIANRALRPLLGIVDPLNTDSCTREVHISSGLDVLFHSLESWTAIPFNQRVPRPANPILRPAYQGANPMSDVFSEWALRQTVKFLPRVAADSSDREAKSAMLLASSFAGVGFGNAGVHLCHGISYPVSGLNYSHGRYQHPGYSVAHPIVPHGISVALTGPAVFNFTAPSSPARHRAAADIFNEFQPDGVDTSRVADADVGALLHDRIARFLVALDVPRGLGAIGYKLADVDKVSCGGGRSKSGPGLVSEADLLVFCDGTCSWSRGRCLSGACLTSPLASPGTRGERSWPESSSMRWSTERRRGQAKSGVPAGWNVFSVVIPSFPRDLLAARRALDAC